MWIVDRLEDTPTGTLAVCEREDGAMENVPLARFNYEPREGDCVQWQGEVLVFLPEQTRQRREKLQEKLRTLFGRREH